MPSDARQARTESSTSLGEVEGAWPRCQTELNVSDALALNAGTDHRIAFVGSRQHGRIALWQLRSLGVNGASASKRCRRGLLHRIHSGVYAIGHRMETFESRLMGAVLAGGVGAVASHLTAARLLGIWERDLERIEISVRTPGGHSRPGLRFHRNCRLDPLDATVVSGIPTTNAPRTLMDSAARLGPDGLRGAVGLAHRRGLLQRAELGALLGRARGLRGVAMLRVASEELRIDPLSLRSELEGRFLSLCRAHPRAPEPLVNQRLRLGERWVELDFHWPERKLVVETDGFAFHSDPGAHEADRRRDQDLQLAGWQVYRFTWAHVTREPWRVRALLDRFFGAERRETSV